MTHRNVQLPGSVPPIGYADATLAARGTLLHLGGHVAFDLARTIQHPGDLVAQVRLTLANLCKTLHAAGALPEHLVKLTIYTPDVPGWRHHPKEIGAAWKETLGRVWPAMTLVGVAELFDPEALVEIDGIAVIPS